MVLSLDERTNAEITVPPSQVPSVDFAKAIFAKMAEGEKMQEGSAGSSLEMMTSLFNTSLILMDEIIFNIRTVCLRDGESESVGLATKYQALKTQTHRNVVHHHALDLKARGELITDTGIITEMYDMTNCTITVCKESELRGIRAYTGKDQADSVMETFLESIMSLGKIQQLNETGLRTVIFKKLESSAKLTTQGLLYHAGKTAETIPVRELIYLLEKNFMVNSDPRASLLALECLPKMQKSTGYTAVSGKILRLAKLSTRDMPDLEQRKLILSTRALNCFTNILVASDIR